MPSHLRILVIGLGLIAWVEAALPAESFEGKSNAHQVKSEADYEAEGYTAVPLNITPSRQVQIDGTLGDSGTMMP